MMKSGFWKIVGAGVVSGVITYFITQAIATSQNSTAATGGGTTV